MSKQDLARLGKICQGKIKQDLARYYKIRLSKIWQDMTSKIRKDLAGYDEGTSCKI